MKSTGTFHFDNLFMHAPVEMGDLILFQAGDFACTPGYEIYPHVQVCYEISYVVSGKARFYIENKQYDIKQGDIFLCTPGQTHTIRSDVIDPVRYYYLGFSFTDSSDLNDIKSFFDIIQNPVTADSMDMEPFFAGLCSELLNKAGYPEIMIESYMQQLIVLAYRDYRKVAMERYNPLSGAYDCSRLAYEVISYIDANILSIRELSDIATRFGYSYSYLSHIFSKTAGVSIKEYFTRKRFEKAASLLTRDKLSITDTAESLGYQSIHSFSKAFKNYYGMSPSEYTAKHKTKSDHKI